LNLITGQNLPSGSTISTEGLSFKKLNQFQTSTKKIIVMDTAGLHTPITVNGEESITEAIAYRKATEFFLRDCCLELGDQHIVVVTEFSDIDQEYIIIICNSIIQKMQAKIHIRPEIFICHNYKDAQTFEETQARWDKYVVKVYENVAKIETIEEVPVLIHFHESDGYKVSIRHLFICNNNDSWGKEYNNKAAKLLRNFLSFEPPLRNENPLELIRKVASKHIVKYIKVPNSISNESILKYEVIEDSFKKFFVATQTVSDDEINQKKQLKSIIDSLDLEYNENSENIDHNCQFSSVKKLLNNKTKTYQMRKDICKWLEDNEDTQIYGKPLFHFLSNSKTYQQMLQELQDKEKKRYGDHLTLLAMANVYKVNIYIITSLLSEVIEICPLNGKNQNTIYLGHYGQYKYVGLKLIERHQNIQHNIKQFRNGIEDSEIVLVLDPDDSMDIENIRSSNPKALLTNYELHSTMGIQFDYETKFVPKVTQQMDKEDSFLIEIDVPGFENVQPVEDEKIKGRWIITGNRKPNENCQIIESSRKFGDFKYIFDVPNVNNRKYNKQKI